ncbi:MAG TPA: hypothetical protein VHW68_09380 [Actinomycetota bacterium]|jgi:hypothetical protein|nr:hypothetical protein [Actinomycetota bacterium]
MPIDSDAGECATRETIDVAAADRSKNLASAVRVLPAGMLSPAITITGSWSRPSKGRATGAREWCRELGEVLRYDEPRERAGPDVAMLGAVGFDHLPLVASEALPGAWIAPLARGTVQRPVSTQVG